MRIVEIFGNEDEDEFDEMGEGIAVVRWKERVDAVLEIIDEQLEAFGLEIVLYDIGEADDYIWGGLISALPSRKGRLRRSSRLTLSARRAGKSSIETPGRTDEPVTAHVSTCIFGATQLHLARSGNDSDPFTRTIAREQTAGFSS